MTRTRRTIAAALPLLAATLGVSAAKETPIIIDELYDPLGGDGPIPAICNATSCNFFFLCNRTSDPSDPTTSTGTHCGQVDASPAMPANLFLPANRATLQAYINYTQSINLYSDDYCQGFQTNHPTLGSCADQGYKYKHANEPGREIQWAGRPRVDPVDPQPGYPSPVFEQTCFEGCGCCANFSTQVDPAKGTLEKVPCCSYNPFRPGCDLKRRPPTCGDKPISGNPAWCGICGPTLNSDRFIDFFFSSKVQSVCEPIAGADKGLCAAAVTPLACQAHPRRCKWRPPTLLGECVIGNSSACDSFFPAGGVACGGFDCLPTFDCSKCADHTTLPGVSALTFGLCCDDCETCVSTGNGTARDKAACDRLPAQPSEGSPCTWKDTA